MAARSRALAGTRAGATPCPRCRHARLRHAEGGHGRCTAQLAHFVNDGNGGRRLAYFTCPCRGDQLAEESA